MSLTQSRPTTPCLRKQLSARRRVRALASSRRRRTLRASQTADDGPALTSLPAMVRRRDERANSGEYRRDGGGHHRLAGDAVERQATQRRGRRRGEGGRGYRGEARRSRRKHRENNCAVLNGGSSAQHMSITLEGRGSCTTDTSYGDRPTRARECSRSPAIPPRPMAGRPG